MHITTLMLGSLASNCYIVEYGKGNCILIDIGGSAPVLQRRLAQMQCNPSAILLTHGHYDHIAGVEEIRKAFAIPVYVHQADQEMLTDVQTNLGDWIEPDASFQPISCWETIQDGTTLQFSDDTEQITLTAIHTPGHTKGSVCWICGNALFTGDTLFRLSRGRTDFPGGSDREMLASFRRLAKLEQDYQVLPGHNEASTLSFEKSHNPTMRGL